MSIQSSRTRSLLSLILGVVTLGGVAALLVWDAMPAKFPARSHDYLAAFSLAMIAVAFLVFRMVNRAAPADLAKACVLAAAFLFWAANQFWPNSPRATLFNDIAIALFVLDVFLVIVGRPADLLDSSFSETAGEAGAQSCDAMNNELPGRRPSILAGRDE